MANFRPTDRLTDFLLPPSINEWLPERHLARFVVEVIDGLDLTALSKSHPGTGSASYHPAPLLGLLIYGYATGVFSSRKLERATYDSVAFRFITANDHPDHDTIAAFRRRFLPQITALFIQVLSLAREMGVLKLGTVALDGTKIHANANRHKALSYERAGKKPGGRPPAPPAEGPLPTDQINLTDEDSRIMPMAGGGFEQCYNAQAAVAADSLLVVAVDVVQAPNDKQQIEPMLEKISALPDALGKAEILLADTGYFSAGNVTSCMAAGIEPLIAMGRQPHHPPLSERFAQAPKAPQNPTPVQAMAHRLSTAQGRKLYGLRKQIPEPVFGIVKSVM